MLNPNVPAWFEIPTAHLDRAQRFYEAILTQLLKRERFGGADIAVSPRGEKPNTTGALIELDDCEPSVQGSTVHPSVADLKPVFDRAERHGTAGRHWLFRPVPRLRRQSRRPVVADMTAGRRPLSAIHGLRGTRAPARRQFLRRGVGTALLAALAWTQSVAAATTALYRNQLVASAGNARCCAIVELRQYTLRPGRFDAFAKLFEDEFVDPLEAAGMTVIGQFRDLDDPNRFVWLRGFRDMPSRAQSLEAFYSGPIWKARRDAANANFIDTDNVLLLHPATPDSGVSVDGLTRAGIGATASGDRGFVIITVYPLNDAGANAFPAYFEQDLKPALARAGIAVAAAFETETSPNTFPRLPVREGEHVFVWIARFSDRERGDAALQALTRSPQWREETEPGLQRRLKTAAQVLRLAPTPRSLLRG